MKKKVVYACLIALAVWPAIQIYLTQAYSLSSWKLAGWGMYATPRIEGPSVELDGRRRGRESFQLITNASPSVRLAAREFLKRYFWLRDLIAPDEVARGLLAQSPEWDAIRVRVSRPDMDARTGMIGEVTRTFEYRR